MKRIVAGILILGWTAGVAVESRGSGIATLYTSYLRYTFARRVAEEGAPLAEGLAEADAADVAEALEAWTSAQAARSKLDLEREFGDAAPERFRRFVETLLESERSGDAVYLDALSGAFGLGASVPDYASLRDTVMQGPLADDMNDSAWILGSLQSWTAWKREGRPVPPLMAWLTRPRSGVAPASAPSPAPPPPAPGSVAALAAAESAPTFILPEDDEDDPPSPLAAYGDLVKRKRETAVQMATAGGEQVLAQRTDWESEQAAKKAAAAEADAEAVRRHSESLAQADKDALEQQQNSWKNKLKGVAGALVSSAVSSFTSGVGQQAGEKLAEAVFGH